MSQIVSDKERLFAAAAELPTPEQRRAFLDAACAANPALRREVEELLEHDQQAGTFLGSPAVPQRRTESFCAITERPGAEVGPYKLLEQIGEGGFGVVFMAEQLRPVRRKVALKVIKPGMDTRQVIARFEAERQALALMDHPNIARVLDAGETSTGRPYFVMELVKGIPITQYCDEAQLTARERLGLFVSVCHAVQHAHQKGIIHRDLKPTNVLVTLHDGTPVVKVIDFGVAKATGSQLTDKTLFTGFAQMIGTPLYMSPEQAALSGLDIDTRSDVYSLGVLLYELLTGTTPLASERFRQAAFDEIRRLIREEEPPKPSTRILTLGASASTISAQRKTEPQKLQQLLRNELDWIVMRSLEKDRTRRYETAIGLARDVQRYLDDQPVEACPPSPVYRLSKFVRRNRIAVLSGSLVAASLVMGTIVSLAFAITANRHRAEEMLARSEALNHLQVAEEQRRLAEEATAQARAESEQRQQAVIAAQEAADRESKARMEQAELRQEAEERGVAIERQKGEIEGLNHQLKQSLDNTRRSLYAAQMNLIPAAWEADNLARVRDLLQATRPLAGQEDQRGFEWFYWNRQCHSDLHTVNLKFSSASVAMEPCFSADGRRLAVVRSHRVAGPGPLGQGTVILDVWDVATGQKLWSQSYRSSAAVDVRERQALRAGQNGWTGVYFSYGVWLSPDGERAALWIAPQIAPGLRRQTGDEPNPGPLAGQLPQLEVVTYEVGKPEPKHVNQIPLARPGEYPTPYVDVAFSRDGSRVLTGVILPGSDQESPQGALQVWSIADGQPVSRIEPTLPTDTFSDPVNEYGALKIAVNHDASRLAASLASKVIVWNSADGSVLREFPDAPAQILRFSPDGNRLATTSSRGGQLHDLATGQSVEIEDSHSLVDVDFSPDGKRLAATTSQALNSVWLFSALSGGKGPAIKGHAVPVSRAQFADDGRLLTVTRTGEIKVWNLPVPALSVNEDVAHDGRRLRLPAKSDMAPDGSSTATIKPLRNSSAFQEARYAASRRVTLRRWPSGQILRTIEMTGEVQRTRYSARGNRLLILSCADDGDVSTAGEIRVVEVATGEPIGTPLRVPVHESKSPFVVFPDASRLTRRTPWAALSADGRLIAYSLLSMEQDAPRSALRIVEVDSGRTIATGPTVEGVLEGWEFSADGSKVLGWLNPRPLTSSSSSLGFPSSHLLVYDAGTATQQWMVPSPTSNADFSPDGRSVSAMIPASDARDSLLCFKSWDADTGTEQVSATFAWPSGLWRAASANFRLSPDGRLVAATLIPNRSPNGPTTIPEVQVLDARTGAAVCTLAGHTAPVTEIAFSPDSRRIVTTTGADGDQPRFQFGPGETKVWDAQSGHELLSLDTPLAEVAFAPDGSFLVGEHRETTGSRIISLDASPLAPEREAEQLVGPLRSQRQNGMPLSRAEIRRRLDADPALDAQARAAAERLVGEIRWTRLDLGFVALDITQNPGLEPQVYRQFLELSSEACETSPDERWPWNYRGYAHYRLGQYADALAALERAQEIQAKSGEPLPNNLVFLAMTHHRLGHADQARELLREAEQLALREPALERAWRLVADEAANLIGIKLESPSNATPGVSAPAQP